MVDPAFVAAMCDPRTYPHDCSDIRLIETHISWVFLTGDYAYKLKKPVDFGFLDFSTLARRQYYCTEECRCNASFAPELYCGVVAVAKDPDGNFHLGGDGEIVEYAVKMRQFEPDQQLDHLLECGLLTADMLRQFATELATIYCKLPRISDTPANAGADRVLTSICDNFRTLAGLHAARDFASSLDQLRAYSIARYYELSTVLARRVEEGWIRERHGDLHLSNLVLTTDGIRAFDCIEFSQELRRIDAIDDIAFLFMDCAVRSRQDLAYAFIDGYLEASTDYSGACLLRFYAVYRSLVRAKVAALQLTQRFDDAVAKRLARHIEWAINMTHRRAGRIILMFGLSGSGKSWLAGHLASHLPAIRIRSDSVRRQLATLDRTQVSGSGLDSGIYEPAMGEAVYARLLELTQDLLAAGENVIVDAAFLSRANRAAFQSFGASHGHDCIVVQCEAPAEVLRQRIAQRLNSGDDPSEATPQVLSRQMDGFDEPRADERTLRVDTDRDVDVAALVAQLNALQCSDSISRHKSPVS